MYLFSRVMIKNYKRFEAGEQIVHKIVKKNDLFKVKCIATASLQV